MGTPACRPTLDRCSVPPACARKHLAPGGGLKKVTRGTPGLSRTERSDHGMSGLPFLMERYSGTDTDGAGAPKLPPDAGAF